MYLATSQIHSLGNSPPRTSERICVPQFSSVQFSRSVMSNSLLDPIARLPCPSLTPRAGAPGNRQIWDFPSVPGYLIWIQAGLDLPGYLEGLRTASFSEPFGIQSSWNKTSVSRVPAFVSGTAMGTLHKKWMKYRSGMNTIGPNFHALKGTQMTCSRMGIKLKFLEED